jgi:alanyl-tRNA synthetase
MKLEELRTSFLNYFQRHGHQVVKSSSLVPQNDPTLLFTNAGMNQFKDVFLGMEKRPYSRATSSQKCFRVSGKHNDLENVGHTARHHTFFEMLGNFSFGDYFKEEAIAFAWELLVKELGLDKSRLWFTVFRDDDEAFELWRKVAGVPASRIVRMGEKDNFWSMGETGPCGPCSEIIFDQGEKVGCGKPDCRIGCDCDRYLELWNLVFMQYNRDQEGKMTPLPRPSIDTGMGLERITAVMQGVFSNYDTDHFQALIQTIAALAKINDPENQRTQASLRVIADHARAIAFLIADGILPANDGRGYVLRRVMRRAARHARLLGFDKPVLYKVCERVAELMGNAYPELLEHKKYTAEVIINEEERFLQTLDNGLRLIRDEISRHKKDQAPWSLPGEVAFRLYDTYGFPLDLTQAIGRDEGFVVDTSGFEREMEKQRERARAAWKGSGAEEVESVFKQIRSRGIKSEFSGYHSLSGQGRVLALICNGAPCEKASDTGIDFQLIADQTPFYGEVGGQVGDQGIIKGQNFEAMVLDAKRPYDDLVVHHCRLKSGEVKVGDRVELSVDQERREDIARNHSATHLLQAALRKILGEHVQQKGSLVDPDRLRFDFTHFSPLAEKELLEVEKLVNKMVRANSEIQAENVSYQKAIQAGAMALFGEKYGETVRMVSMGDFSKELCGGTHCRKTGDIGFFKIVSEGSVAAGVRRIEALTGRGAVEYMQSR